MFKTLKSKCVVLITGLIFLFSSPAYSALIASDAWNYEEYKATWSNTQETSVGALLGESNSTFVMWQSFSTTQWMKYILSFTYMATTPGYDNVKLRVTVFDGEGALFEKLLDETLYISDSMRLLTYNSMFQAMSETSVVRFALTSEADGVVQDVLNPTDENDVLVKISDVTVKEVSEPSVSGLLVAFFMIILLHKSRRKLIV